MSSALQNWQLTGISNVSLDAAGLVALADLTTIARRTALTGTSSLLDAFVLAPGLHRQQYAPELNGGEWPACAAMTTGYVFRVENPATVMFLQKVGRTGHLTTLSVSASPVLKSRWQRLLTFLYDYRTATMLATSTYLAAVAATATMLIYVLYVQDWWAFAVISLLVLSRTLNVYVIRCRSVPGWSGAKEPGVKGDLLILLSQDRWVRIQGEVDDLKAVTSGRWLQEPTFPQSSLVAFATLLVYLDAALAGNAEEGSKLCLLVLLFASAGLLALSNENTDVLQMHGRVLKVTKAAKPYSRRLVLAEELIKEQGREDWAIRLGMVQPKTGLDKGGTVDGPPTM